MRSLLGRRLLPAAGLLAVVLTVGSLPGVAQSTPANPEVTAPAASRVDSPESAQGPTDGELAEAALAQVQGYLAPQHPNTQHPNTQHPNTQHPNTQRPSTERSASARVPGVHEHGQAEHGPVEQGRDEQGRDEQGRAAAEAVAAPDLTMALRELRLRLDDLSGPDRAAALRVTARPSANMFRDFGPVRVHWSSTDSAAVARPVAWDAWVNRVGSVVTHVLATYQAAGYRAPQPDAGLGGTDQLDIYLVDFAALGDQYLGIYGYCDTDKQVPSVGPRDTWAYCAFDHTFEGFAARSPLENLRVTAAHELFHATQFAYDYREDVWFMEATAVWVEDEVYDSINDNLQYNDASPLREPRQSLDQSVGLRHYGSWFFFRYLSERFPRAQGELPIIMRRLWERADASSGAPNNYSIQAVRRELASRNANLRRTFTQFADGNRRPKRTYAEGAHYPKAPATKLALTRARPNTGWQRFRLDHLASATYLVKPRKKMRNWRLRVAVNLARKHTGSAAMLTAYGPNGRIRHKMVKLSKAGKGSAKVRFDSRRTRRVELTIVNASTRYRCGVGWVDGVRYPCDGKPRDDRKVMKFRLRAVR